MSTCVLCRGKIVLDYETGEKACSSCGLVVGRESPEIWNGREDCFSLGRNEAAFDSLSGISQTRIDWRNVDSNGKRIFNREDLETIRRLDRFTANSDTEHRNLSKAMSEITRIAEQLGIGSAAAQEACSIYLKAFHQGLIRGRSIYGIGTATIYLACRRLGIPRMIEEIADFSQSEDKTEIASYCKLLIRRLGIDLSQPSVNAHVAQIARNAKLSTLTQRKALSILNTIENNPSLAGRRPISIAAAALYLACKATGEPKSQLRIAGAANLTPTTVRKSSLEVQRLLKESSTPIENEAIPSSSAPSTEEERLQLH